MPVLARLMLHMRMKEAESTKAHHISAVPVCACVCVCEGRWRADGSKDEKGTESEER